MAKPIVAPVRAAPQPDISLSHSERRLIMNFRRMDGEDAEVTVLFIETVLKRTTAERAAKAVPRLQLVKGGRP